VPGYIEDDYVDDADHMYSHPDDIDPGQCGTADRYWMVCHSIVGKGNDLLEA
jgi:hypothetical protein